MKKWLDSPEWEEILREHPELSEDLDVFFSDQDGGIAAMVGFYAVLKTRLRRFLSPPLSNRPTTGEAKADEETPPRSAE